MGDKRKPGLPAKRAAAQYLRWQLGDRRGFRSLLEEIAMEDPELSAEIRDELARCMEDFAARCMSKGVDRG